MPNSSDPPVAASPSWEDGEAATAFTDGLLAIQSGLYFRQLGRTPNRHTRAVRRWRAAFGAAAVAALAGGTHHALPVQWLPALRHALWKIVGIATGAAGLLLLMGGIEVSIGAKWRRLWLGAATIKSILLGINSWRRDDFRYLILDYGSSMLALLALQWWRPNPATPPIRTGIWLSFLAAALQQKGPRLHRHFDHNALYHLVQMGAFHFLAQAGPRLQDKAQHDKK